MIVRNLSFDQQYFCFSGNYRRPRRINVQYIPRAKIESINAPAHWSSRAVFPTAIITPTAESPRSGTGTGVQVLTLMYPLSFTTHAPSPNSHTLSPRLLNCNQCTTQSLSALCGHHHVDQYVMMGVQAGAISRYAPSISGSCQGKLLVAAMKRK